MGGHGIWRLHGDQTEQLHQVILQHVSQLSDLIVIRKTTINADGFRHRDLHMIDAGIVPLGIDKTIGKTQRQQILDCFLAQIVYQCDKSGSRQRNDRRFRSLLCNSRDSDRWVFLTPPAIAPKGSPTRSNFRKWFETNSVGSRNKNTATRSGLNCWGKRRVLADVRELHRHIVHALTESLPQAFRPPLLA